MALVPGSWAGTVNRSQRQPSFSDQRCPVCNFWLHTILVATGVRIHPLCDPRPAHLRSVR